MAFSIKATIQELASHASASGFFQDVLIGEPKSPPTAVKPTLSLFIQSANVVNIYLDGSTQEVHTIMARIYRDMLQEPIDQIEYELADAAASYVEDILEEFDQRGSIREIDAAGQYGSALSQTWGHVFISNQGYRVVDISIPCVVDDSITMAA